MAHAEGLDLYYRLELKVPARAPIPTQAVAPRRLHLDARSGEFLVEVSYC